MRARVAGILKKMVLETAILFAVWVALAGTGTDALIVGAVISLSLAWLTTENRLLTFLSEIKLKKLWVAFPFLLKYIFEEIRCHIYLLIRIYSPHPDIKPEIIKIPTLVNHDASITSLANLTTLLPGTFTLEATKDFIVIHAIDTREGPVASVKKMEMQIAEVLI